MPAIQRKECPIGDITKLPDLQTNNTEKKNNENTILNKPNNQCNDLETNLKKLLDKYHISDEQIIVINEFFRGAITREKLNALESILSSCKNNISGKLDFDKVQKQLSEYGKQNSSISLTELDKIIKETPKEKIKELFFNTITAYESEEEWSKIIETFKNNGYDIKNLQVYVTKNIINNLSNPKNNIGKLNKCLAYFTRNADYNGMSSIVNNLTTVQKQHNSIDKSAFNEQQLEEHNEISRVYAETAGLLTVGTAANNNLTEEQQKILLKEISDSQKEYPTYKIYLEAVAHYVNSPEYSHNIAVEKLNKILDEATNKEYSKTVEALKQKSAVDENGQYKNKPAETAANSAQRAAEIKQEITQNTPKEPTLPTIEPLTVKAEQKNNSITESPLLSSVLVFSDLSGIFSGKAEVKKVEEDFALNRYKEMTVNEQMLLLFKSTNEYLDKLIPLAKISTLVNYLKGGNKGPTSNTTKQMKDRIKESEEKNNTNSLPS